MVNNENKQKMNIKTALFIFLAAGLFMQISLIVATLEKSKKKEEKAVMNNQKELKQDKILSLLNNKKVIITENDLDDSFIIYKNVTMKFKNKELIPLVTFGDEDLSEKEKKDIKKILNEIKNAKVVSNLPKDVKKYLLISGKTYYIDVFSNKKCTFYDIKNNDKERQVILKSCKKD